MFQQHRIQSTIYIVRVSSLLGYCEFRQDGLELLAAGFLTPLHHLVQERGVSLGHGGSRRRRRSGQLLKREDVSEQWSKVSQSMTHRVARSLHCRFVREQHADTDRLPDVRTALYS